MKTSPWSTCASLTMRSAPYFNRSIASRRARAKD